MNTKRYNAFVRVVARNSLVRFSESKKKRDRLYWDYLVNRPKKKEKKKNVS